MRKRNGNAASAMTITLLITIRARGLDGFFFCWVWTAVVEWLGCGLASFDSRHGRTLDFLFSVSVWVYRCALLHSLRGRRKPVLPDFFGIGCVRTAYYGLYRSIRSHRCPECPPGFD